MEGLRKGSFPFLCWPPPPHPPEYGEWNKFCMILAVKKISVGLSSLVKKKYETYNNKRKETSFAISCNTKQYYSVSDNIRQHLTILDNILKFLTISQLRQVWDKKVTWTKLNGTAHRLWAWTQVFKNCRQKIKSAYFIRNQGKPNCINIQILWLALFSHWAPLWGELMKS